MMQAIVQDGYGSATEVLRLQEVEVPDVADDEVLVRVRAASVHPDIWHVVAGWPYVLRLMGAGLRRPKQPIPGTDLAGEIETVGKNVGELRPGDAVFGESHRGLQWRNGGTFAQYVAAPQDLLALKPAHVTFEQAAAVPTSGIIALQSLQNGRRLQLARHVLINGAAGGVGSIALQIAKAYGAHVTGVDGPEKLEVMRSLGADEVIDYTKEDFTQQEGRRYDLIVDVASTLSLSSCKRAMASNGIYVVIGHDHYGAASGRFLGSIPVMLKCVAMSPFTKHLPKLDFSIPSKQDAMAVLKEMLEAKKLTPVIDRTYPLGQVAEAIQYLQTGRAIGKIIITP